MCDCEIFYKGPSCSSCHKYIDSNEWNQCIKCCMNLCKKCEIPNNVKKRTIDYKTYQKRESSYIDFNICQSAETHGDHHKMSSMTYFEYYAYERSILVVFFVFFFVFFLGLTWVNYYQNDGIWKFSLIISAILFVMLYSVGFGFHQMDPSIQ